MSSATALTLIHQLTAPAQIKRPDVRTPANDPFPNPNQQRPQKRFAGDNVEDIGQSRQKSRNGIASLRDQRRADGANKVPRRRESDYRQSNRQLPAMAHVESGFVAQFIALEIIPGGRHSSHDTANSAVSAYESANERNEIYADPYHAVNVPA